VIDRIVVQNLQMRLEYWLLTEVLVWSTLAQLATILAIAVLAWLTGKALRDPVAGFVSRHQLHEHSVRSLARALVELMFPIIAMSLLWTATAVATRQGWPHLLLSTTVSLLSVWIVIRIAASIIRDEAWARFVAVIAFTIATLNILNLLAPTANLLHSVGLHIGDVYISVLTLLQAAAILAVLLWVASVLARVLERRIRSVHGLNPSMQVLTGKLLKLALLLIAILIALRSVGVDLTAFAVFTGAVGVGVGLGLQRIVSNLISGIILLLDRSIKPGDVIELQDTFGWVSSLGARYTSVTTRDGKEWLIPNEDLITQRVVNWSFSSERLRLSIPFGISYDSDVRLAMNLAIDSAQAVSRVLQEPPPACRLIAFGNSSIDLELRLWINDPASGVANVRSAVLLGMWDRFKEQGVHIPFPQRDLHIKDGTVGVKDGTVGATFEPGRGGAAV
jgi:small-conductance mechanosensitive channel